MGKRVLIVTNTASMVKLFNIRNIKILQKLGHRVFVATNFSNPGTISEQVNQELIKKLNHLNVKFYNVKFSRGIGNPIKNRYAFKQLSKIVDDNSIDVIHTHAPLSSIISRRVAHAKKIKCIYTSHGFQFFHGGPLRSWLLFYPIERFYAKYTDALITINRDDYELAQSFPARHVYYIPGVGTNIIQMKECYKSSQTIIRNKVRKELGITPNDFMILSVGELSKRKNHLTVLKAIAKLNNPSIKYMIAGIGPEAETLKEQAKEMGLENQFRLLGFRRNVKELYLAADLNAFISLREGLGMGGLEGCALGLYIIASGNTGAKDYVTTDEIGIKISNPLNVDEVSLAIKKVMQEHIVAKPDYKSLSKFDVSNVDRLMEEIYRKEIM